MTQEQLTERIRTAVWALEPKARIYLYGSRARRTADADSDWDLLVLLDDPASEALKRKIRRALYEIEWGSGEVLSVVIRTIDDWQSPRSVLTPLYQAVTREGIPL